MKKKFDLREQSLPSNRDWGEDFIYENGNYQCLCIKCDNLFYGHKRRCICKICANR